MGKTPIFLVFRSCKLLAGCPGNKMQRDHLKSNCPTILAASTRVLPSSTTVLPPISIKNLGHLGRKRQWQAAFHCLNNLRDFGRRRIAWSRRPRVIMFWLAVSLLTSWFRATLSIDFIYLITYQFQCYGPNRSWKKHRMLLVIFFESLFSAYFCS